MSFILELCEFLHELLRGFAVGRIQIVFAAEIEIIAQPFPVFLLQGVRNPGFLHAPAKNLLDLLRYFFHHIKIMISQHFT